MELSGDSYLWVKALHIISVIAWMAGLLYLPRLYVYHSKVEPGSETSEMFKIMERRLLRAIMNPAMISSYIFGGLLIANMGEDAFTNGWLHVKLACLVFLTISHMMMAKQRKNFAADNNRKTEVYYRIFNEVPTILMIIIVIMAVLKPF